MTYEEFLIKKNEIKQFKGIEIEKSEINNILFEYQKDVVKHAIKKSKYGIYLDTGLGKTFCLLEIARIINNYENRPVLILSPLAVLYQTIKESKKINIKVNNLRENSIRSINIINYEKIESINQNNYCCVILDESSILKSYSGKYRNEMVEKFKNTPYKFCLSATPSPNDNEEMGNQAEFLGICTRREMLATYFINDLGDTGKWRLKGHAKKDYFDWLSSWCVFMTNPNNLGYSHIYNLPELNIIDVEVKTNIQQNNGYLFNFKAESLDDIRETRKNTLIEKVDVISGKVNYDDDFWLIWCFYNDEAELLAKKIKGSVNVQGSDDEEIKANAMNDFADGKIRVLITKPKIAGFGMNWQHCRNMIFLGTNNSYEQYYQAIRRCYRYGQKRVVNVYLYHSELEHSVRHHIERKEKLNDEQKYEMERLTKNGFLNQIKIKNLRENVSIIIPSYLFKKGEQDCIL